MSYHDTQEHRLGSANFEHLPINRPVCPVHNNQRDGFMQMNIYQGKTNYYPNSIGGGCPMTSPEAMAGYAHYMEKVEGHKIRQRSKSFSDHFTQATLFWNSLSAPEKEHLVKAAHFELGKVESKEVRQRMVENFNHVDHELAKLIAMGIGVPAPTHAATQNHGQSSPAVSIENMPKPNTVKTRRIGILAADGFDYSQLTSIKQALKGAGALPEVVSKFKGTIKSADGQEVEVDKTFLTSASVIFDAIYVPGGKQSIETLKKEADVIEFINDALKHYKAIAATGEGVDLLMMAPDIKLIGFDKQQSNGHLVSENGIITSRNASDINKVGQDFIQAIAKHRHWTRTQPEINLPQSQTRVQVIGRS
jgi:catalase